MFDVQLGHRKVGDVGRRQRGADADGSGPDQAVGLMQRHAFLGVLPSPAACEYPFADSEWRDAQPVEESPHDGLLVVTHPAPDLLDGESAHPRLGTNATQPGETSGRGSASERVDENRRVEQQARHSAGAARVAASLRSHPLGRVVIPDVPGVSDGPERRFDVVPSPLVVQAPPDQRRDEGTALTGPDASVELGDQRIVQRYV